jgi:hypothetical protein
MTTNKPIWLTAWLYACAIWMNIEQGWRMFRWDYKTWLFFDVTRWPRKPHRRILVGLFVCQPRTDSATLNKGEKP